MIPDKPFTTLDEQIDIIASRNVKIERSFFTYESLISISYYTLMNGYKNTFLAGEGDNFVDGTTFEMIYICHWLDISFSNIMLKYILLIEKSLKTKLSYIVAEKYGVFEDDYLNYVHYNNSSTSRDGVLNDIKKAINDSNYGSATKYYQKRKNHIPPWIIVNDLMLGLTIQWYLILKAPDKEMICSLMLQHSNIKIDKHEQKEFIKKSLFIIKEFRNKVAHGSRTLNLKVKNELPSTPLFKLVNDKVLTKKEYNAGLGKNDLFAVIIIVLLLINDDFQLKNFVTEMKTLIIPFEQNKDEFNGKNIYGLFNLPNDLFTRIEEILKIKKNSID